MNLAENLKKIRKDNNLSQEQLAEQLGVSRQSVSKWESGQAYPEMDKVLQLAKMFNLNIDDLLNQDVREINTEKQSKVAINKYIDDFLMFITKTIDMFMSMRFKDKCKCIFEQIIVGCILLVLFTIVGAIGSSTLYGLTAMLPFSIQNIIYSICSSIYLVFSVILGFILLIHIFKTRYLDYYVIVKENVSSKEDASDKIETTENNNKKIYLEKKKEEIIIRDPKHSGYRFISGMLKCVLFCIKGFVLCFAFMCCISLIILVISLVISFLIIKTGLFFVGIFLSLLATISINLVILLVLFNFVFNKKTKKKMYLTTFIISIVVFGIGIGITAIDFVNFNYIEDTNNKIYIEDEIIVPMQDNLVIHDFSRYYDGDIAYIEEERNDIKIVYKHTKYMDLSHTFADDNNLYLDVINSDNNYFNIIRETLKDINNKEMINYSKFDIYIYTSKENIEKLENNKINYYESIEEDDDCIDCIY